MVNLSRLLTNSPGQTQKLAQTLAKDILKSKLKKAAFVIALQGELGGGKTTFLQGLAKSLGIKEKILSPTFVIIKRFKIRKKSCDFENFYHIDCYRIQKPKEILDLGVKEVILNPKNIVAIEWADRIKKILPQNTIVFKFKFIGKLKREITFNHG
jgi:tRNA threonylcarbamoyl adenosine modification protein YjeE